MEYTLDGEPLDQQDRPMYSERPIHGGAYEARPDVMAVVHNHSPGRPSPLASPASRCAPCPTWRAVVGEPIPVWDIRDNFSNTSLLVTTMEQGRDPRQDARPRITDRRRGRPYARPRLRRSRQHPQAGHHALRLPPDQRPPAAGLPPLGDVNYLSTSEIQLMAESLSRPSSIARAWEYWATRAGREP